MELLTGADLHEHVIIESVLAARKFVWIATANLKDMHIEMARRRYKPILEVFGEMAGRGVGFRIIHGELPSRPFRRTLEQLPGLTGGAMELQICPRSHWKIVIVDGVSAYFGSANFTGAGLGAKSVERRNFELGAFLSDPGEVKQIQSWFDTFWMGAYCPKCAYRDRCPDPIAP